ncbi:MAG: hypothetical protein OEU92_07890, partial [Alphaproteobacteria bacterium]|nr:hypothetical protein [Alphaproteobacteria bacterium]
IIDFAHHDQEFLRQEHAHRRLGFDHDEMQAWFEAAGLMFEQPAALKGDPLTVVLWTATRASVPAFKMPADDGRRISPPSLASRLPKTRTEDESQIA